MALQCSSFEKTRPIRCRCGAARDRAVDGLGADGCEVVAQAVAVAGRAGQQGLPPARSCPASPRAGHGRSTQRATPIGFQFGGQAALTEQRYKLYRGKGKNAAYELYDLLEDPGEQNNLAAKHPDVVDRMSTTLSAWIESCQRSDAGKDHGPKP